MRNIVLASLVASLSSLANAATVTVMVLDTAGRPLSNAVVSLKPAAFHGGPRFAFPTEISQRDIQFTPALAVVPVGTRVRFPNFDKVRHHVYSFSRAKKFELKLYGRDDTRSVLFDRPGTVSLGCNIHDQMNGVIRVVDAPFAAVTNSAGKVSIANVPAGLAQLVVWHPRARLRDNESHGTLTIPQGGAAETIRLAVN